MEHYNLSTNDFYSELISKIDNGKSDENILGFIKLNMIEHKIILSDLKIQHINHLIKICEKYNLKYDIIGYTKKVLIINNTSHKYIKEKSTLYIPKNMGYTNLNKTTFNTKIKEIPEHQNMSKYILDDRIMNNNSFEEESDNEVNNDNKYINNNNYKYDYDEICSSTEEDTEEDTIEDTEEENEEVSEEENEKVSEEDSNKVNESSESSESSSSYTTEKTKGILINYNNIFTKGEHIIYIISNINLICNMFIIYKLFYC